MLLVKMLLQVSHYWRFSFSPKLVFIQNKISEKVYKLDTDECDTILNISRASGIQV